MNDATREDDAPWLRRQRERLLAQRGHAWLLQGPSGLGQYALGLSLVKTWLCERPNSDGACGECDSCHLVDTHAHPDLVVLMPETEMIERGWPLPESAQKDIDDKKRKASKEIRVEAMRDMVGFAQRTSARGRGTAVLVYPAERMNHVTANALLKTLEEPAGDTRFVLASESAHQLLPTIRSRCQTHVLAWPADEEAIDWLLVKAQAAGLKALDKTQVSVWLKASGGRPEDALNAALTGLTADRWADLPAALARGDWSMLDDWSPARQLDVLQKLCHDLMAVAAGGTPRFFEAAKLPPPPRLGVLVRWSKSLAQAARSVEHPYNAGLMREAWVASTRQVLARGAGRA